MNQLTYTFKEEKTPALYPRYRQEELQRMTLLQLRDICEQEKIIHAAVDRMDREELIHLVMHFRGSRTPRLIRAHDEAGQQRLQKALRQMKRTFLPNNISLPAKITVFQGLDTNWFDGYSLPYHSELDGVNAAVIDNQGAICALLNIEAYPNRTKLHITRSGQLPCQEAAARDYRVYIFPQKQSDQIWSIYTGTQPAPPEIQLYSVPLLEFAVRQPVAAPMPLVIDFGTSNSAAGMYIDQTLYNKIADAIQTKKLHPNTTNYVRFIGANGEETPILPTMIGVDSIINQKITYNVGHEAEKMISSGYMSEGFCVFCDIKRWVSDFTAQEELTDNQGNRVTVPRQEIIRAFVQYIIDSAAQQFKCRFSSVFMSHPVKQKERFLNLYQEILPDYTIEEKDLLDEGAAVLYSTIANQIDTKQYQENQKYNALILRAIA